MTGSSNGVGPPSDYATIKYSASGTEQWVAGYNGLGNSGDGAVAIAIDGSGNICVTGSSDYSGGRICTTIKYAQSPTSVGEKVVSLPASFALKQNYPNPFNPTTTIGFSVSVSTHCTLRIFNLLGQELSTLVDELKAPGSYTTTWNGANKPSGVYLYRLQAGQFSETKKLILLR